ncbi:MAG: glycosyltransferase family 39 protein [Gemmataceae bacterium]
MRRLLPVAILLFFAGLQAPLLEPEEARYAEIPRQMLAADRWLVPTLHGQDYLDKPPLFYWLVMGCYRVFGVHDWAARIVPALAAVLTVAVVYGWTWAVAGRRVAFAAGLVLLLTPEFIYRGRFVTMNGLLALFTTAALACGHVARLGPRLCIGWWLTSAACVGLGLLTKGPVAAALVLPPMLAHGWLDRRLARVPLRWWLAFGATAVAVAAPWFVAVAMQCPEFVGYFFWFHHVVRYTNAFDHAKPWWAYLPQLALGLLPWTLLLPLACRFAMRRDAFALVAAAWMVLFFSLAGSKRPVYLVPALPPLAIALAGPATVMARRFARPTAVRWATAAACAAMLVAVAAWWPAYAASFSLKALARSTDGPTICYPQPWEAVTFYGRGDVRWVRDRDELVAALTAHPGIALVVRKSWLGDLPPDVAFAPTAEAVGVTVGKLRPRRVAMHGCLE